MQPILHKVVHVSTIRMAVQIIVVRMEEGPPSRKAIFRKKLLNLKSTKRSRKTNFAMDQETWKECSETRGSDDIIASVRFLVIEKGGNS